MIAIVLVAVFFAGMGIYGLVAPAALVRPFGIQVTGPHARTEVRAVYGGFGLAIAGLLVVATIETDLRRGIVIAVAVALAGMAVGRLIGRLFDRPAAFYPIWFYFWFELLMATVLWIAVN